jgi:hypothetical protein
MDDSPTSARVGMGPRRSPLDRRRLMAHLAATLVTVTLALVLGLAWIWFRLFACWDNAVLGGTVLCHLEVPSLLLLAIPFVTFLLVVRPFLNETIDERRARHADADEHPDADGRLASSEISNADLAPPPPLPLHRRSIRRTTHVARRVYALPPLERGVLITTVALAILAMTTFVLFLYGGRFNLFWTY